MLYHHPLQEIGAQYINRGGIEVVLEAKVIKEGYIRIGSMYKNPAPTTNVIIVKEDRVCLLRRKRDPCRGKIALPGGYVEYGETVESAAIREAKEETGLDVQLEAILGVYSDAQRNPSKHTISTVFIAKVVTGNIRESEEGEPFWQNIENIQVCDLAFDHGKIMGHFLSWQKHQQTFWSYKDEDQDLCM